MAEEKLYQPGWEERKEREKDKRRRHRHHHHEHADINSHRHTNSWGGWMKMHDVQVYYGLMFIVLSVLGFGAYKLVKMFWDELKAMPMDDPKTEVRVDELDVRKAEKQDMLIYSDSLAQMYELDSSKIKRVQTEGHHVYRPPRRNDDWYINQREWRDIWKNIKRWKQAKKNDERLRDASKQKKEDE